MRLCKSPTSIRRDSTIPMINIAFLLLIFFLLVARIVPSEAFEVTLPTSEAGEPIDLGDVLVLAADGRMGYADARDFAVWQRIEMREVSGPLVVRADENLQGAELATLAAQLTVLGVERITLLTERR